MIGQATRPGSGLRVRGSDSVKTWGGLPDDDDTQAEKLSSALAATTLLRSVADKDALVRAFLDNV